MPGFNVEGRFGNEKLLVHSGFEVCEPAIFIDGIRQFSWLAQELNSLLRPEELEGVEVYRRALEAPPQFQYPGGIDCGSIVIWTRWRRPAIKMQRPD
jgi:hypothetical protein